MMTSSSKGSGVDGGSWPVPLNAEHVRYSSCRRASSFGGTKLRFAVFFLTIDAAVVSMPSIQLTNTRGAAILCPSPRSIPLLYNLLNLCMRSREMSTSSKFVSNMLLAPPFLFLVFSPANTLHQSSIYLAESITAASMGLSVWYAMTLAGSLTPSFRKFYSMAALVD